MREADVKRPILIERLIKQVEEGGYRMERFGAQPPLV